MSCGIYRTFLDTNIVWCADWLGPYIFDDDEDVLDSPEFNRASQRQQREWLALAEIFRWAEHVNPVFVISKSVVNELRPDRRPFGWNLHEWSTLNDHYSREVPPTDADHGLLAALPHHPLTSVLPDSADRRLLAEAVFHGCDSFLTMDLRTIWRHRRVIRNRLGIRVLTPSRMFEAVFMKLPSRSDPGQFTWVSRH